VTNVTPKSVIIPEYTNSAGTVVPATHVFTQDIVIVPAHYTTNLADKPLVTGTTGVVGSLPVPFASLIATVFGGLYALYRNIRNKQALLSVIQGVEAFRKTMQTPELQGIDSKLKDFLIEHQEVAGTLNTVSTLINTYTDDTVPKKP
jgi:hypothetical protein